ncbi:MAG: 1,4-dihydroxy-2-naphthoate polyprenyltransferase [Acidimicrobiales bacterium]|nr:1,4-dihydroxy-2-naphthoate polyprenyltransferase [Acidimicrobiales bacterium]
MNKWIAGARPRTLPAAIVPVAVGTAAAYNASDDVIWWRAVAALIVALGVQVGTNYVNDYADGVRGTDDVRVGPVRLVGQKLASPEAVKRAAILSFAVAAGFGLALCAAAGWELVAVGSAAILAGWFYTGGPRPYGYAGLGEVFVFVFFGLVATAGSTYVQIERITLRSVLAGVVIGLWATALLVVNNLRDREGDAASGKKTLAVRMGDGKTRVFFIACLTLSVFVGIPVTPLILIAIPFIRRPTRIVSQGATGRDLVGVLMKTSTLQIVGGAALSLGLVVR